MGSAIGGFVDKVSTLVEHAASGKLDMNDLMTVASLAAMCCTGGASAAFTGAMEGALTSALGSVVESAIGSAIESAVGEGLISEAMGEALKEVVHVAVEELTKQGEQKLDEGLKGICDATGHEISKDDFKGAVDSEYKDAYDHVGNLVKTEIEKKKSESGGGAEGSSGGKATGSGGGGKGFFSLLAEALGAALNEAAKDLEAETNKVRGMDDGAKNESAAAVTDMQAASQRFSFLMNAATNVLQTVGGGYSTMAKKG